jgi:hypothetical protein
MVILAFFRNQLWSQGEALWKDAVEKADDKGRNYLNLATSLMAEGKKSEALIAFEKSLDKACRTSTHQLYPMTWA